MKMAELPNFDFESHLSETNTPDSPDTEPQTKKARFASFTEEKIDELLDGATSKSTKYSTNFAVNVYKGK
jgi:hypothetical protein